MTKINIASAIASHHFSVVSPHHGLRVVVVVNVLDVRCAVCVRVLRIVASHCGRARTGSHVVLVYALLPGYSPVCGPAVPETVPCNMHVRAASCTVAKGGNNIACRVDVVVSHEQVCAGKLDSSPNGMQPGGRPAPRAPALLRLEAKVRVEPDSALAHKPSVGARLELHNVVRKRSHVECQFFQPPLLRARAAAGDVRLRGCLFVVLAEIDRD